jgi:hypothetical protein
MRFEITEQEYAATLLGALRAACDQYSTDAAMLDRANQPHVAEAMRKQIADVRALAAKLSEQEEQQS